MINPTLPVSQPAASPARDPLALARRAWDLNPTLAVLFWVSVTAAALSGLGMILDPRLVLEKPVWAKTFKFSLSFVLYAPTLLWALSWVQTHRRAAGRAATVTGLVLLLELALLVVQGARGEAMHFNVSTPFNAALWGVMSFTIVIFWGFFLAVVVLFWRQMAADRVLTWAVRLGLAVTFIGFGQGYLMTGPNAAQMTALQSGQAVDLIGAHTVGAAGISPDAGPGLPVLGWSTTHGDLRIGHFIGIHALQVLPLFGLWLTRRRAAWLSVQARVRLVWIAAAGYLGLVALVTWQALRGQPLLAPDALTLTVAAGLALLLAGLAGWVVAQARRVEAR